MLRHPGVVRRLRQRRTVASLLLVALVVFLSACGPEDDERVALDIGDHGIVGEAPTYIALEAGYFADEGLDVTLHPFRSAVDMVSLLGSGEIDAGAGTVSAALFNALSEGIDVRIVADSARVLEGEDAHLGLVIRQELVAEVFTVADLVGRPVAINAPGGGLEVQMSEALAGVGLTLEDVEVTHLAFPEMTTALANGSVDAAIVPEPFLTFGKDQGVFSELVSVGEIYPGHQISTLLFSPELAAREEVATAYLRAYLRGVADYRAALIDRTSDPTCVIDAIMAHTPVDDRALFDRMGYHDIRADGEVNQDSLEHDIAYYRGAGYLDAEPDLKGALEMRFLEEARATLDDASDEDPGDEADQDVCS